MRDDHRQQPLRPVDFLVLLELAVRERHGYALVQAIEEQTGGAVRLVPGNLYRILKRMMRYGWIEESMRRPVPELDDQRRRYYRMTEAGRRVAAGEAARLADLLVVARGCDLLAARGPADAS